MSNPSAPFYLEKFTTLDGGGSYTFPVKAYQLDQAQTMRTAFQQIIGADYAVDLLAEALAPKDPGRASHHVFIVEQSGTDVDDALDAMRTALYTIAQGKLYLINADGSERWAFARITQMPSTTWKAGDLNFIAVALDWTILSDFYSATQYSQDFSPVSDPETITVPNGGTARVFNAIFILEGPYSTPELFNNANGYQFDNSRVSAIGTDWIKLDAGQGVCLFSDDSGVTYQGDFVNVSLPTQQVQLMILEPGDNLIDVHGLSGGTLHVEFYPAFD